MAGPRDPRMPGARSGHGRGHCHERDARGWIGGMVSRANCTRCSAAVGTCRRGVGAWPHPPPEIVGSDVVRFVNSLGHALVGRPTRTRRTRSRWPSSGVLVDLSLCLGDLSLCLGGPQSRRMARTIQPSGRGRHVGCDVDQSVGSCEVAQVVTRRRADRFDYPPAQRLTEDTLQELPFAVRGVDRVQQPGMDLPRGSVPAPSRCAAGGRMNTSKLTSELTGLPGRVIIGTARPDGSMTCPAPAACQAASPPSRTHATGGRGVRP